jgi:heterodisulfide reductase subunit B
MADVKISALPASTVALAGTEVLPIVQSSVTKQVSVANLTAGRAVSASSLALTTALPTTSGGTGLSSFTSTGIVYASSASALATGSILTLTSNAFKITNAQSNQLNLTTSSTGNTQNIQILNGYSIKKIVTACPHCFNTLKNEYPELGGHYEVIHHATFIQQLMDEGKIVLKEGGSFVCKKITYHDSCYLGRANNIYEAPRKVLEALDAELIEMKRCKSNGLCCGAGGAQMFKEAEKGNKEVNVERAEEALALNPDVIAVGCPFCNTMMTDGVKHFNKEEKTKVLDIAELIATANEL